MTEPIQPEAKDQPQTKPQQQSKKGPVLPAHYELTVEGTALISDKVMEYEVTTKVPDLGEGKGDGHYLTFILSENNGELLAKAIRKKYKACESIRTHYLVSRIYISATGEAAPHNSDNGRSLTEVITVANMRKNELLDYIKDRKYDIDLSLYKYVDEIREAVQMYEKDKEKFLAKQEQDKNNARIKREAELLNG